MAKLMVDGIEVGGTYIADGSGSGGTSTNASDHIYDNTNSENITSENVQGAIDELDKRISEQITLGKINSDHRLLESVDFNDILEVGQYYVSSDEVAATCVNIPEPVAGTVFVTDVTNVHSEMGGTQVAYRVQYYNTYTNNVYSRDVVWDTNNNTFGDWRKVINSSDLDEVGTPYTMYDSLNDLGIPVDGTASTTTVLNAMAAHSILITQNNVDLMLSDLPTTDGLLMIIKYGTSRNYAEITNQDGIKYFKSSNLEKWESREWQVVATNADLDTLSSNLNVKVERFDESTATLYLVPVK